MADVNDWVIPGENDWVVPPKDTSLPAQVSDAAWQLPQGFNRGVDSIINLPYNLMRGAAGVVGYELPEAKPIVGQLNSGRKPQTTAGRYAESVGEAIGASSIPSAGLIAKADKMRRIIPATTPQAMAQTIGETIAANPTSAAIADALAATGSGIGHQAAEDSGASPAVQTLAGMAGAATPLAVGATVGKGIQAVQSARASSDPYARVTKGLGDQSIDDLADSISVGTTRYNVDINRRVLRTLGEEMAKADGDRSIAIPSTLRRLEVEGGVAPATAQDQLRRVVNAQRDSDLMFGEYPAVVDANMATRRVNPVNITDDEAASITNPGTQRLLDYVANSGSLASSQNVKNAIGARAQRLKESTEDAIQSMSPNGKTIQDVADMMDQAAKQASAEYTTVHNTPSLVNTAVLQTGLSSVMQTYAAKAAARAGEQGDALRAALREFYVPTPNGQALVPTLQMAQDARGALRGIIRRNNQAGNEHIVNTLQPLYDDISAVMRAASPRWAAVNRKWADLELDKVAADLGESFASNSGPKFRQQRKDYDSLAPEAKEIVQVHLTQWMLDKIENAAKLGKMKNLGESFTKAHTRKMIRDILGDDAAVKLARLIRDANVMARSRDMMKGSPTQPRQQMQKEQDADLDLLTAADTFDWGNWRKAIFDSLKAVMRERRNKTIGKVITTPIRDTPAVAEHLERMRHAQSVAERYARPYRGIPAYGSYLGTAIDELTPPARREVDVPTGVIRPYSGVR